LDTKAAQKIRESIKNITHRRILSDINLSPFQDGIGKVWHGAFRQR